MADFFVDHDLIDAHKLLSWLGSVIGMPFLAAGILRINGYNKELVLAFSICPVVFLFFYKMLPKDVKAYGNLLIAVISVFSILISSMITKNNFGIFSAIVIILASIVGAEGSIYGIPRVDLFHYLLAAALVFHAQALGISIIK